jgi:hypothetical protein
VDFAYAATTEEGLAVYRAAAAPEEGEDVLAFAFQGGIDLREGKYALISSDGNFVDGVISNADGTLDFSYARARVGEAAVYRRVHTDVQDVYETITAQVVFDRPVAVDHLGAGELYLQAEVLVEGGAQPIAEVVRLPFASLSADRQTIVFESAKQAYPSGRAVTLSLRSGGVETASGKDVLSADDKIPVASAFAGAVAPVTFNTAAGITGVTLKLDGGFNAADNIPVAEVAFDAPVRPESFAGTWLAVEETARDEDGDVSTVVRALAFDRVEQDPPGAPATSPPTAVFRYGHATEKIAFAADEAAKSFALPVGSAIQGASGAAELLSYDGNVRIDPLIGVAAGDPVGYAKAQATTASLVRTPGAAGGEGNTLTLSVSFDRALTMNGVDGVTATLAKTAGGATSDVVLPAKSADGARTIVFEGTDGLYTGGADVAYRLAGGLTGLGGRAVDAAGIDLSPRVDGLASLAVDNQGAKAASVAISLEGISEADILPAVNVSYGVDVDAASFQGATLTLEAVATLKDGGEVRTETPLAFTGLVGGRMASFAGAAPMAADAVQYRFAVAAAAVTGAVLLDEARSVRLDTALPAGPAESYKRPEVTGAAFTATWAGARELALRDVALTLTFDKPVVSADLAQLSLKTDVSVTRAGGSTDLGVVEFAAAEAVNASTVRLWADSDAVVRDASSVTVALADTALPDRADGRPAVVDETQPGVGVLRSLPAAEAEFPFLPKAEQAELFIEGLGGSYVYGAGPVRLSAEGGTGSGAVVFSSSDSNVASVSGDVVTIRRAGSFRITATKAADAEYNEAATTSGAVTVAEAVPVVTVAAADVGAGEDVTLAVAVAKPEGSTGMAPAGTVTFREGAAVLAAGVPLSAGTASHVVTAPSTGVHVYTVDFSGQAGYYTSATGSQAVGVGSAAPTVYRVLAHFGTWTGEGAAAAKIDADHAKFTHLALRDAAVDPSHYSVEAGSTVITLDERYLKTLPNGTHTFTAHYSDGHSESITLTADRRAGSVPSTGADVTAMFCLALLTVILGIACIGMDRRFGRANRR